MVKTNISIRVNPNGGFELFYFNSMQSDPCEYWLESFCKEEGHNEVCLEYMYKCKPANTPEAIIFAEGWAERVGEEINIVKRLKKPV